MADTDEAEPMIVLAEVSRCAASWVPDARLLGNVRAGDIVRAIQALASSPTAAALDKDAVRLALEDADWLERIAEEADDNNWQDWAAAMRQAATRFRAALDKDAEIARMRDALVLARNRLQMASINASAAGLKEYWDYREWADEASAALTQRKD